MGNLHLPPDIVSPRDVSALSTEIRAYAKWFTHNTIKATVGAPTGKTAPSISPVTIEVIKTWVGSGTLTDDSLSELLKALEAFRRSAPTMTITLAAPAGGDLKRTLITWCRENVAGNMLISFKFNRTLLGGMVIRVGSHVYDWSFRRKLLASNVSFLKVLGDV